jgi:benzylsuccinate CoA-transferase BbsE subunit
MQERSAAQQGAGEGALAGIKVLEISGLATQYCGKMYAELGADVILVEPPGGAAGRRRGPYVAHPGAAAVAGDLSLSFAYFNTSKRSVTLDLEDAADRDRFLALARDAQLVLESEPPGRLDALGCGYDALSRINPALVVTSITPYGQTGPFSQYVAEDLATMAAGGFLYLGGYPDTEPIGACYNQAYAGGSMFGAVASMLALTHAELQGEGEHVDVSMQECMVLAMENSVQFYDLEKTVRKRSAGVHRFAGTGVYPCRDGHVYMMAGGIGANRFWGRTIEWLTDEKVPGIEQLLGDEWNETKFLQSDVAKTIFTNVFGAWARGQSKNYLYHEGQRRHVPVAAINDVNDLVQSEQLAARNYFVQTRQPSWPQAALQPGAPYQFTLTPWAMRRRAPLPGEHNSTILGSR